MNYIARHATKAPVEAGNRADTRISIRHGTNGAQWHNVALEGDEGAAQVLDCTGLIGGPCTSHIKGAII
jgi:hypothetical protein